MRTFPLLLLAAMLAASLGAHAGMDTVVLVWSPPEGAGSVTYDVYGVQEGTLTPLGSTRQTVFAAPAGYERYAVKFHDAGGEHGVGVVCVAVEPHEPGVTYELWC